MADENSTEIPEQLTIQLRDPVTVGSESWSELRLREPTAAEWLQWDRLEGVEANVRAVSVISGVPEVAVRQLKVRDLNRAAEYIARFFS